MAVVLQNIMLPRYLAGGERTCHSTGDPVMESANSCGVVVICARIGKI